MTLRSKIYGICYEVQYPSRRRAEELQAEFATAAKGKVKPGGTRKYFVCIHCGRDSFSNKMMLNRHRYVEGCDGAKHPDGSRALLLPYPDFKRGEGKRVEVLGKVTVEAQKKTALAAAKSGKGVDATLKKSSMEQPAMGEGSLNAVGDGVRGPRVEGNSATGYKITPAPDIICGKVCESDVGGDGGGDGHKKRKTTPTGAAPPFRSCRKSVSKGSPEHRVTGSEEVREQCHEDVDDTRDTPEEGDQDVVDGGKRKRSVAFQLEAVQNLVPAQNAPKQDIRVTGKVIHRGVDARVKGLPVGNCDTNAQRQLSPSEDEAVLSPTLREVLTGNGNSKKADQSFHVAYREPGGQRGKKQKKSSYDADAEVSDKQRAIDTLRDRFTKVVQSVLRGPHSVYYSRKCSGLGCSSDCSACDLHHPFCDTGDGVIDSVTLQDHCIGGSDTIQCHSDGVPEEENVVPDTPFQNVPVRDTECTLERISAEHVWVGDIQSVTDIQQYWANGKGSRDPFAFFPEAFQRFTLRAKLMNDLEEKTVTKICKEAESAQRIRPPPVCPPEPRRPGLYYLRDIGGDVTLPWVWECHSGDDFLEKWEKAVRDKEFREKLPHCTYWWSRKKVSCTYQ